MVVRIGRFNGEPTVYMAFSGSTTGVTDMILETEKSSLK